MTSPTAYPDIAHWPWRTAVTTRWSDNDVYGHVNNAVYYHYFDSAINALLIAKAGLDIHQGGAVGFIVHSSCDYLRPVAYPEALEVGVAVEKLGNASLTWAVGLLNTRGELCARGRMVHVWVDRATRKPMALPAKVREALSPYAAA
jgi:acyl-CoA thioester hydrolase